MAQKTMSDSIHASMCTQLAETLDNTKLDACFIKQ